VEYYAHGGSGGPEIGGVGGLPWAGVHVLFWLVWDSIPTVVHGLFQSHLLHVVCHAPNQGSNPREMGDYLLHVVFDDRLSHVCATRDGVMGGVHVCVMRGM